MRLCRYEGWVVMKYKLITYINFTSSYVRLERKKKT